MSQTGLNDSLLATNTTSFPVQLYMLFWKWGVHICYTSTNFSYITYYLISLIFIYFLISSLNAVFLHLRILENFYVDLSNISTEKSRRFKTIFPNSDKNTKHLRERSSVLSCAFRLRLIFQYWLRYISYMCTTYKVDDCITHFLL